MAHPLVGEIELQGDKSISHRVSMFAALADGISHATNVSSGGDVASTIACLQQLGADIHFSDGELIVHGAGLRSLSGTNIQLDCGNSGTSLRLLCGLLSGQDVHNVSLVGDESLSKRPHNRVIEPLHKVGVDISGREGSFTPVVINQSQPTGGTTEMNVASAQVKSAILLSGLYSQNETTVIELAPTRDHTEKMLTSMGVDVRSEIVNGKNTVTITSPTSALLPLSGKVPSDPSSAAFFGVAACIIPGSDITIKNMLLNPTRSAWLDVLTRMGASIEIQETKPMFTERVGNVHIAYSKLNATDIQGDEIPALIDELPILSLAMACAEGNSTVRNAEELRIKESDRISIVVDHLTRSGVPITESLDGYEISGSELSSCDIDAHHDHRIAMTFAISNYIATGSLTRSDEDVIRTSFPTFFDIFASLITAPVAGSDPDCGKL